MGMMPSKPRVAASSTNGCSYAQAVFTIVFYAYKSIGLQFFFVAVGRQTSTGQCVNVEIGTFIHWVTHSTKDGCLGKSPRRQPALWGVGKRTRRSRAKP